MIKKINENFKYIYLMTSLIAILVFCFRDELIKAAVTGLFAIEYVKILLLSELSEYLKTSTVILYKSNEIEENK